MRMRHLRLFPVDFPVCMWCSFQINFVVCLAVFKACCCESTATGERKKDHKHKKVCRQQEGEVNTSDLADPMIQAIMTSRRKKRANAKNFRKWRRRPLAKQLFGAGFSTHCSLRLGCVFVERCNYYPSLLRGKWNSEYGRKIMRKVYLKRLCPYPLVKII